MNQSAAKLLRSTKFWVWGAMLLLAFAWWVWMYPTCSYNYKLTLEVTTLDGVKTGSSVIHLKYRSDYIPAIFRRHGHVRVTGEAAYVDLGGDRNLFALLTNHGSGRERVSPDDLGGSLNPVYLPRKAFRLLFGGGEERKICSLVAAAKVNGPKDVEFDNLPTLVTFRDIMVPTSVEMVDPENLSRTFGPGYELKSARIEITDDIPKDHVQKVLPWVLNSPAPAFVELPNQSLPEILRKIRHGDFKMKDFSYY